MNNSHDKMMKELHRLLESQNFESEEELRNFMNGIMNKKLPSTPNSELSNRHKAQDLVFEAYEVSPKKGKAKIAQALKLDSDCFEAYEYLGSIETNLTLKMQFFEKGISIGRRIFGGEFMKEHKGYFWGFTETRPFMRCMDAYSHCVYLKGEVSKCIAVLEEMIELNPNDNQGVRDQLLTYLIEVGDKSKFIRYDNKYKDDECAFGLYNRALFTYMTEGDSEKSQKLLSKAIKQNGHVPGLLLADRPVKMFGDSFIYGDKSEAEYYVYYAYSVWRKIDGAIDWLIKQCS